MVVTALLLLMMSTAPAGKDPCDAGRIDGADDALTIVFSGADWKVSYEEGSTTYENRLFVSGGGSDLQEGFAIGAMLTNGTAIHFKLAEKAEARSHTNETGTFTEWQTAFPVDDEMLAKLATAPITAVRADMGTGPVTTEVSKGRGKKLHNAFKCIAAQIAQ
ncbi:MAG: hypothetical protein ACI8PZ_002238 [Myxococcota bacterium]